MAEAQRFGQSDPAVWQLIQIPPALQQGAPLISYCIVAMTSTKVFAHGCPVTVLLDPSSQVCR